MTPEERFALLRFGAFFLLVAVVELATWWVRRTRPRDQWPRWARKPSDGA